MEFVELYKIAEDAVLKRLKDGQTPIVSVSDLARKLKYGTSWLDAINFYPVKDCKEEGAPLGMFKCYADQDFGYDESGWLAAIYYNEDVIEDNDCWRRFVCCKELMHVFDTEDGLVNTSERYIDLAEEIANRPLGGPSPALISEHRAQWMALLILCPKTQRDIILSCDETSTDYEIALRHRIPEEFVPVLKSDDYENAFNELIQ